MRYMIALIATLLILAAWPTDLRAQGRNPGPVLTDSLIDSYAFCLNLTTEQEIALRSILETQSEKAQEMIGAARAQGREAMGAMRPKLQELQEDTNSRCRRCSRRIRSPSITRYRLKSRKCDAA